MLGDSTGAAVATVEHLMAALAGLGVDNALVEIDGAGNADHGRIGGAVRRRRSTRSASSAGAAAARHLKRPASRCGSNAGRAHAELAPGGRGLPARRRDRFRRAAASAASGAPSTSTRRAFRRDIARARTFGFVTDVKKLWQAGFALGSSLENSIALDGDAILNPEGLRYADEFVRHKALDAVGDLALAGAPIVGAIAPTVRATRSTR